MSKSLCGVLVQNSEFICDTCNNLLKTTARTFSLSRNMMKLVIHSRIKVRGAADKILKWEHEFDIPQKDGGNPLRPEDCEIVVSVVPKGFNRLEYIVDAVWGKSRSAERVSLIAEESFAQSSLAA